MHQRAISLETFADIFEELTEYEQVDVGSVLSTTGLHPILGAIVAIQDIAPGLILLSQFPLACLEWPSQPSESCIINFPHPERGGPQKSSAADRLAAVVPL